MEDTREYSYDPYLEDRLQLSRNYSTKPGGELWVHLTTELRFSKKGYDSRTGYEYYEHWQYTYFLKTTLLLFMKKSLKVNTTRVVRQQFTNFINISHLLLVKPSDLMNDTPVFPSSYKMKWFFDALCLKSVFLEGLFWVFSWFYCCGWLVCLIKWRCDTSKYHKPSERGYSWS